MKRILLILCLVLSGCGRSESAAPPASAPVPAGDAERGRALVAQKGCLACHIVPGVPGPRGRLGPSLAGMGSRPAIVGRFPNTHENMTRWLLDPQSMSPMTTMPGSGSTPQEAADMSSFMSTLK